MKYFIFIQNNCNVFILIIEEKTSPSTNTIELRYCILDWNNNIIIIIQDLYSDNFMRNTFKGAGYKGTGASSTSAHTRETDWEKATRRKRGKLDTGMSGAQCA